MKRTKHAVRNIRLCTKDCLCLYVCPVGATDTETGQIDWDKCTGCGICQTACPSGAISMIPDDLPPQQKKTRAVADALFVLVKSKVDQEVCARKLASQEEDPIKKKFYNALVRSNRLMAEDLVREAGYMLIQSNNTHEFLVDLIENSKEDFPLSQAQELLKIIKVNDN